MARPSPSCAHDDDRLRLPPASPPSSNSAEKKESTGPRRQLCPPCATPFSNSSLDYRRSDARIVENGFAASSGVSKSAKVVLAVTRKGESQQQSDGGRSGYNLGAKKGRPLRLRRHLLDKCVRVGGRNVDLAAADVGVEGLEHIIGRLGGVPGKPAVAGIHRQALA